MPDSNEIKTADSKNKIPSARFAASDATAGLGLLAGLAGSWGGSGFNLIARPAFHYKTDLYLQLNQTHEHLHIEPIGSNVPNRGFGQEDINLFGLTYLQKIRDAGHDGALHIEPGIWVTQPSTTFPAEADPAKGGQIVARMGSIPHGNALLAQGTAQSFKGPPVLTVPGSQYNGSSFPSFNSTPFGAPPTAPAIVFNAAGSSEKLTAVAPAKPFPMYDLTIPDGPNAGPPPFLNTRTPYDTSPLEPSLPANINGIPMQDIVNDPILLLQKEVEQLVDAGYTFEGTVLNIATQGTVSFLQKPNTPAGPLNPTVAVTIPQFGGGTENIQFLEGEPAQTPGLPPATPLKENAQTAIVYATFWIEKVTHSKNGHSFMQLQYAQMVVLNFPIFHLLNPAPSTPSTAPVYVNLGWPHISVATLRKTFG